MLKYELNITFDELRMRLRIAFCVLKMWEKLNNFCVYPVIKCSWKIDILIPKTCSL